MTDVDSLSSVFISHMKILFDILDENHTGSVRLSDIESHWEGSDCVIPGNIVIQSLRNVASSTGRLSFDALITGLESALTTLKSCDSGPHRVITSSNDSHQSSLESISNNIATRESVPSKNDRSSFESDSYHREVHKSSTRWNGLLKSADAEYNSSTAISRADVAGLKSWQPEVISSGDSGLCGRVQRKKGDASSGLQRNDVIDKANVYCGTRTHGSGVRRHTVSSDVNTTVLRQLKQIDMERRMLSSGLEMVELMRSVYLHRITQLSAQKEHLHDTRLSEDSLLDVHSERLDVELSLITALNQQLKNLIDCFDKGFPLCENVTDSSQQSQTETAAAAVKSQSPEVELQNEKLRQELDSLQQKVKKLENEKAQLIREVFQANSRLYVRTASPNDTLDTTLI